MKKIAHQGAEKIKPAKHKISEPKHSLIWEAPEFRYYHKNRFWIFGILILMIGVTLLAVSTQNYLMIAVAVLATVVFYQHGHVRPKKEMVELTDKGVKFRGQIFSYLELRSFWIVEEPHPVVYIEQVKFRFPITILLEEQSVEEVRSFLMRYLPEHPTAVEHFADRLTRLLRF